MKKNYICRKFENIWIPNVQGNNKRVCYLKLFESEKIIHFGLAEAIQSFEENGDVKTYCCLSKSDAEMFFFKFKNQDKMIKFDWNEVEFDLSAIDGDMLKERLDKTKNYTGLGVFFFLWRVSQGDDFGNYFSIKKEENNSTLEIMNGVIDKLKKYDKFEYALYCLFEIYSQPNVSEEFKIMLCLFSSLQIIKFGPPGTGKSHSVVKTISEHCCQVKGRDHEDVITTVFHPDYSYGDFTAKLVPVTVENDSGKSVEYQIHAGPLTKALARAFVNRCETVYLVIEEINRGNTAAIFGDVFQLLDRDECGESEYPIHIQTLFYEALKKEFNSILKSDKGESEKSKDEDKNKPKKQLDSILKNQQLFLPSNLSIIATMNTSDESVFYMDSAFKRRWHFEYIDVDADSDSYKKPDDEDHPLHKQITAKINGNANCDWDCFRKALNTFIKDHKNSIRRIEDKLIGLWFIKAQNDEISESEIKNKLMHYLWDNVFARDKQPLIDKIKVEDKNKDIVTFGDFIKHYDDFIKAFGCSTEEGSPE